MVLEPVLEPIVLGFETDEDTGGLAVARNHDLLGRREPQVPRKSSLTTASATSRFGRRVRVAPRFRLAFRDDVEDLDFLADDVMEYAALLDAEAVLRLMQLAVPLDAAL